MKIHCDVGIGKTWCIRTGINIATGIVQFPISRNVHYILAYSEKQHSEVHCALDTASKFVHKGHRQQLYVVNKRLLTKLCDALNCHTAVREMARNLYRALIDPSRWTVFKQTIGELLPVIPHNHDK
jgi:hypothetical protein